jgi:hypothetical protein
MQPHQLLPTLYAFTHPAYFDVELPLVKKPSLPLCSHSFFAYGVIHISHVDLFLTYNLQCW